MVPYSHAVLGTIVNTLAWRLLLRDHPWNIVRDCSFSLYPYLAEFLSAGPLYPQLATRF